MMRPVRAAEDILMGLLAELGAGLEARAGRSLGDPAERLRRLRLAWPALTGAALAPLTAPVGFEPRGGLLSVAVEAPWREALFRTRHILIDRLNRFDSAIRGVVLETVPSGALRGPSPPPAPPARPEPPPPPDPRSEGVSDPALRASLDALCAAWDRGG